MSLFINNHVKPVVQLEITELLQYEGGKKMRKYFLVITIGLFLYGCGTAAKESEFW